MTPAEVNGTPIAGRSVDEYVHADLRNRPRLRRSRGGRTLVALVGVLSHRALDLTADARRNGCMAVVGGPHVKTCDTAPVHGRGGSCTQAEAELVWREIRADAAAESRPAYGRERRWQQERDAPASALPCRKALGRYVIPMHALDSARVSPFLCSFCSVTRIAGGQIRCQGIATTMAGLHTAKAAGVRSSRFTSDKFNKYPEPVALLAAMVEERLGLQLFVQCDREIARQDRLVERVAKHGYFPNVCWRRVVPPPDAACDQEGPGPARARVLRSLTGW